MRKFRILQFNMQFGQTWDDANPDRSPINLDMAIAEILSHDADIILLQEVEQAQAGGAQSEKPPNLARLRAALPGYDVHFSYPRADPRELPFGIGQAISEDGLTAYQSGRVVAMSAIEICPRHLPLVRAFADSYAQATI